MTAHHPIDPLQLDRYLANELPTDERLAFEAMLAAAPQADAFRRALPGAAFGDVVDVDTNAAWNRLATRIAEAPVDDLAERRTLRADAAQAGQRQWWRAQGAMRVAAALALVVGATAVWRTQTGKGGELTAPLGRDVTTRLPDGTTMTLAAGSTARWSARFGGGEREVALVGEAYFDVVHDAEHPFRVRTRNAVAEDVGTRFVVRAWSELPAVEVAVEEGIVALADTANRAAAQRTMLRAGDRGRISRDGTVAVTQTAEVATAWVRGELAFDNTPLAEALPAISRRFAVTLRADPSLAARRLSARFSAQTLDDVLSALSLSLGVRAVTADGVITLVPVTP